MWTMLIGAAYSFSANVGSGQFYPDIESFLADNSKSPNLEIILTSDVSVGVNGVTFANQQSVSITSLTGERFTLLANGNAPMLEVPNGSLELRSVAVRRGGGGNPGGAVSADEVQLTDVHFEQYAFDVQYMVASTGDMTVTDVWVCGGAAPPASALFSASGLLVVDSLRIEGTLTGGYAVSASGGGTIDHLTAWGELTDGIYGPGLEVSDSVVVASGVALEGISTDQMVVDRVATEGSTVDIDGSPIVVDATPPKQQVFWDQSASVHCGYDARPHPDGPLWDPTGGADHIGAYHGDTPEPGWDDDDDDGFGYGEDCRDDDEAFHPDATEVCGDSFDQDCDGLLNAGNLPSGVDHWVDADGDGAGDYYSDPVAICAGFEAAYASYVTNADDCADDDVSSLGEETFYEDADNDGYPNQDKPIMACEPGNYELPPRKDGLWDCRDFDDDFYPGAPELCGASDVTVDADCDGVPDAEEPACLTDSATDTGIPPGDDDDDDLPDTADPVDTGLTDPAVSGPTPAAAGCGCQAPASGPGVAGSLLLGLGLFSRRRR